MIVQNLNMNLKVSILKGINMQILLQDQNQYWKKEGIVIISKRALKDL